MFDLGKTKISINCPSCEFVNKVTLDDVSKGKEIICKGCLNIIKLVDKDNSTKKSVKSVKKSIDNLSNTLKKLSK